MSKFQLDYVLSRTQEEYVFSDAVVNVLISNTGEGKTFASIISIIVHAQRNGKPIRVAIVRDTHQNIKTSTVPSIIDAIGPICRFYNDYKMLRIFSNPPVEVHLFGIDDLASLSKLQGPEYAMIWLEEPAPMSDRINAGLSEDVFNAALVRCARQKGTIPRLQVSMNPSDQEHWTYKRFLEDAVLDPDNPLITRKVWFIRYGENIYVSEVSRQAVKAAYKNDPAAYARYVQGEFAAVYHGQKVVPQFSKALHVHADLLKPSTGLVSWASFDGWHNPGCILGQLTPSGRIVILDELKMPKGGDIRSLLNSQVIPMINSPRWKDKARGWRAMGDFSMRQPDQSNKMETSARVIEEALETYFESGPARWEHIKAGVGKAFNTNIMGTPMVIIDPRCRILIKGLEGAWHYKSDMAGNISGSLPVKNEVSHLCDAGANALCVLTADLERAKLAERSKIDVRNRKRVASYAVSGSVKGFN